MKKQIATLFVSSALLLSGCASWCEDEACQAAPDKVVVGIGPTNFAFDSAALTPTDINNLNGVVARLNQNPSETVAITGYTDSTGPESYNLGLSERRAATVATYLQEQGISAARMTTNGLGEADPVESNDTVAGRAANRRAEVVFK